MPAMKACRQSAGYASFTPNLSTCKWLSNNSISTRVYFF